MKKPLEYVSFLKNLSKKRFPYEPLITIEISRSRLLHNLNEFRKIAPGGIVAPVLKSNAYGHGLFEVAQILEEENMQSIPFFVVDSYFEAVALRSRGIKTHLLIVGYNRPETILNSELKNISFTVTNIETLRTISGILHKMDPTGKNKKKISLHVKIDTGMRRQGILPTELAETISLLRKNPRLSFDGLLSHFSDADNPNPAFSEKQIALWNEISRKCRMEFPSLTYLHMSATDGHRFAQKIEANVSRLGIGLYGLSDSPEFARKMNLQPVLEMKTIITGIKHLKAGETTGYGNIFTAWKDIRIATIPVGYFEGLNRKISNSGSVTVLADHSASASIICPIVGRVSMNITTIEIPSGPKEKMVRVGSTIIAISNNMSDPNSIASIAKLSSTITYEIAVHIPAHLKRIVV